MKRKSIKRKILLPVYIMAIFFIIFMGIQLLIVELNLQQVNEMKDCYFKTMTKAEELKLSVVQVQQWLTDISATRGAAGFDDGFEEAANHAANIETLLEELKEINPSNANILSAIKESFDPYYSVGIEMANAYIEKGPEGGNQMMGAFDQVASEINSRVDEFISLSNQGIEDSIAKIKVSILTSVILALTAVAASVFLVLIARNAIHKSLISPILEIQSAMNKMASGQLESSLVYESDDEIGSLADNIRLTMDSLNLYINDISACMKEMENGNLSVSPKAAFKGDFIALGDSIVKFKDSVHEALSHISTSAEQVSKGSEQVAEGAQSLAHNAEEQAASIEELSNTISSISSQVEESAEMTTAMDHLVTRVSNEVDSGNSQMKKLIVAMSDIKNSSDSINGIIMLIQDIASQTSMLSLNASIEAARAGEAGRGFAVVADEVSQLAVKSIAAAKDTASLIHGSIKAVENGSSIAAATEQSFHTIEESMQDVADSIGKISRISLQQAEAVHKVNTGVSEITGTITSISSTAEESGASSEELAGQAMLLKEQVDRFRLS